LWCFDVVVILNITLPMNITPPKSPAGGLFLSWNFIEGLPEGVKREPAGVFFILPE
jgi:hypothetical protein